MAQNIVRFGLRNVHYSVATADEFGALTYGATAPFPGAVSLTLDTRGEQTDFYADDRAYYTTSVNNGYEGTYECAEVPLDFRVNVLGDELSADGILTENANAKVATIALMFEFDGDQKATRHVLYNVKMNRPGTGGETKTDTTDPQTSELTFVASPTVEGVVKRSTTGDTPDEIYNAWYDAVYEPTVTPAP